MRSQNRGPRWACRSSGRAISTFPPRRCVRTSEDLRAEVSVERDEEFTAYVAARARPLRRSAYLLCGDWHRAEDLTQSALTKAYLAWPRITRADNADGYVRQILVRTYLDEQRRRWR